MPAAGVQLVAGSKSFGLRAMTEELCCSAAIRTIGYAIITKGSLWLVSLGMLALSFASCKSPVQELTIAVRHQVFPRYYEEFQVKMGQKFQLSDTDYFARAVDFVPDFAISLPDKKVFSRSDSLNNPAVKLIVYRGKEKLEEVWAFQKVEAPHFSPQSMLAFKLLDFKIEDRFKEVEDKPEKDD